MRLSGRVDKSWGYEDIFVSNDHYCGKFMIFEKTGGKTSMHFHEEKKETWRVIRGAFIIRKLDTQVAHEYVEVLTEGQTMTIDPMLPHQIEAMVDDSCLLEISTPDSVEDNYRLYR
jgi:mannose-6-phosphate isomerase-like protein (cupin superfamily)